MRVAGGKKRKWTEHTAESKKTAVPYLLPPVSRLQSRPLTVLELR